MIRRTFLVAASALVVSACTHTGKGASASSNPSSDVPGFELLLIDAQTPFRDTGQPYLRALSDAGLFAQSDAVQVLTLPDYGREGGALVTGALVAVAADRPALEGFFAELPAQWQLPPSHALRYAQTQWLEGDTRARWGAQVVRTSPGLDWSHVATVDEGDQGISIHLDSRGTADFEALTRQNVGQRLAIVLDGQIQADPVINEPIPEGTVMITLAGDGSEQHALYERLRRALKPPP